MPNPGSSDESSLEERFRLVHDHLDLVDRTLDELASELDDEIESALENAPIEVEYDIDTGSFQAELPVAHVVGRLNKRLDPPLFARVEDGTIRIMDIRRLYDIDADSLAVETRQSDSVWEDEQVRQTYVIKDLIREIQHQQPPGQQPGVSKSAIIEFLVYAGLSRESITEGIQKLRDRGELYTPEQGYLRVV